MTRNEAICAMYISGSTLYDCAAHFGLSHERVRQIIRKAGIHKEHRNTKLSPRTEFLGVNISEEDKEAWRRAAAEQGVSMSELTAEIIREKLEEKTSDKADESTKEKA